MLFGDIWLTTRNRAFSHTQQPWNTDHETQVTMMATEGACAWSLSSNIFMAFSTVCPRESACHEVDRSAPPYFHLLWDQLRCCHLSVLLPNGGRFSRVLGSTCDTGLPLLGLPTQLHTVTVGHKTTRTQFNTVRTGCLNRPWRLDADGRHNATYQTERTLVNTATNALDNKCSINTPPSAPRLLDPTAVHDDEDCVLLRQTADPNGAYETQDDLGTTARNHLQPHNFLVLCKQVSAARHSARLATTAPASSSVATLLSCQRHEKTQPL